ncbi:prepilin-type N-terminal cleavage/methylation domain-containing protein [Priestia filamentosa]|uniref:prepilin-type N-terminal cleavage/methylation domain-containing protein n=1 Tax=Priestia filamentosa TaxID=1402861 RepID=UPI000589397C
MKRNYKRLHNSRGFTLIEVLTVIVIIGLLIVFLAPNLNSFTNNSQVTVVETDIRLLKSNVQEHFVDNPTQKLNANLLKKYFATPVQLESGYTESSDPVKYVLPEKKDPWGNNYEVIVGKNELFVAFHSYGPNKTDDIKDGITGDNLKDDVLAIYYPQP